MRSPTFAAALLAAAVLSSCNCGNRLISTRPTLVADPLSLDFGTLPPGTQRTLQLSLRNDSAAALTLFALLPQGDARGAFVWAAPPDSVAPGQELRLDVTYRAAPGDAVDAAALLLETDAQNLPVAQIQLLGRTVQCDGPCPQPAPDAGIVPIVPDAGSVAVDAGAVDSGTPPVTGPVVLAANQDLPRGIAVDADFVYWVNATGDGMLQKIPLAGGTPIALVTGLWEPQGVAVDGTHAYWGSVGDGQIGSVLKTGGAPATLAWGDGVYWVAVDASSVYWTSIEGPAMKVGLTGGVPSPLASVGSIRGLAIDAQSAYFADMDSGKIHAVSRFGGTLATLASGQSGPVGIGVDASFVYWTDVTLGKVLRVPKAGGAVEELATGIDRPWELAVDASGVYLTTGAGEIIVVNPATKVRTTLTTGQPTPSSIVTDATHIYWTNSIPYTGSVMRMAKP